MFHPFPFNSAGGRPRSRVLFCGKRRRRNNAESVKHAEHLSMIRTNKALSKMPNKRCKEHLQQSTQRGLPVSCFAWDSTSRFLLNEVVVSAS
jgi:hypothetical protein